MKGPISPDEVDKFRQKNRVPIPDEVYEAFNELIAEDWDGSEAAVSQTDVIASILAKLPQAKKDDIYKNKWLDVEEAYEKQGWTVEYDKPGYCESGSAYFVFKR